MAYEALQAVIGMGIVDPDFRRSLLEKSGRVLAEFNLTSEETAAIMNVQATTFQGFASELHNWITRNSVLVPARG